MPTKYKTGYPQRLHNYTNQHASQVEEAKQVSKVNGAAAPSNAELSRAVSNPRTASQNAILGLQARYGNQAVQRLLVNSSQGEVQRVVGGRQRGRAFLGIKKDRNDEEIILERLRNPELRQLFWAYCQKESSIENLEALLDIQDYKISPNLPRAKRIHSQYVASSGVKQLNLGSANLRETNIRFQNAITNGAADPAIFDKVISDLMTNILDTWSRFKVSEGYAEWEEKHPQF